MKQLLIIVLLLSIHNIYGMRGKSPKAHKRTNSVDSIQRSTLSHSDPLSTHIKTHDSLKNLYDNLNQKVIGQESQINILQTKIISLETKLSRLSTINSIFITSLIATAGGLVWYKWPTILSLLRSQ